MVLAWGRGGDGLAWERGGVIGMGKRCDSIGMGKWRWQYWHGEEVVALAWGRGGANTKD